MFEPTKPRARAKAIRLKCLDCTCGSAHEVRHCPSTDCPLWAFRLGLKHKTQDPTIQPDKRLLSENKAEIIFS